MERCAYCGDKVGDEALYIDDEIFCSEECMRDYGANASDGDYDDDDDDEEEVDEGDFDDSLDDDDEDY
jgi:hypothetical protein